MRKQNTFLLDIHCLLWFQDNNEKLSKMAKAIIPNLDTWKH